MKRDMKSTTPSEEELELAFETAIKSAVEKGLLVDTGRKQWSELTGRYEIVWRRTDVSGTFH